MLQLISGYGYVCTFPTFFCRNRLDGPAVNATSSFIIKVAVSNQSRVLTIQKRSFDTPSFLVLTLLFRYTFIFQLINPLLV